eukprot:6603353-Pyramimonas_sp.AAC.2
MFESNSTLSPRGNPPRVAFRLEAHQGSGGRPSAVADLAKILEKARHDCAIIRELSANDLASYMLQLTAAAEKGPRLGWSTGREAPRWAGGRTSLPRSNCCKLAFCSSPCEEIGNADVAVCLEASGALPPSNPS